MSPRDHDARFRRALVRSDKRPPDKRPLAVGESAAPCFPWGATLFAKTCVLSSLNEHRLCLGYITIRGKIVDGDGVVEYEALLCRRAV